MKTTMKTTTTKVRKPLTPEQKKRKSERAKQLRAEKLASQRRQSAILSDDEVDEFGNNIAALEAEAVLNAAALEADEPESYIADQAAEAAAAMAEAELVLDHPLPMDAPVNVPPDVAYDDAIDSMATGCSWSASTKRWWHRRTERLTKADLVAAVRQVAKEQYESGRGWDIVVECYSDEDIIEAMGRARSVRGAVWKVGCQVLTVAQVREDIQKA